eukprot:Protomagalhaensia_wolfi_Nauph_80__1301@NODE_1775_length_1346_cov_10_892119_g1383_i0_p1_GENE_NODE_1775_length_1346_cov_10_892119_g1383_i0NODE_1775_length_1346_cov_10_892119_g1383_i0_p1_ORF_typecomplete_len418_score36_19zfCCCH/PF00642_24/1_5e05WD40_like/PF17005_5/0_00069WD40_like/PF17005_5/2_8e03zfCCCH_4/PF18044_1/0_00028Torus/PF16131_5/0_0017WD40/PF00400_32/2_8WD40/PF00400_32/5_4e02WD40/PF00400_32/2_3e03WD40/PF00400_32/4_8e03WD40/PF00400_32/30zf_CCCH_4/PF18345_1/0_005zfCCCH_3/PF15663_5/0_02zfCCCH
MSQFLGRGGRGGGRQTYRGRGRGGVPAGGQGSPNLCAHFTMYGNCKYGSSCRFRHTLRSVAIQEDAHQDFIYCAAIGVVPPSATTPIGTYEIYTGGKDKKVKRWLAIPETPIGASPGQPSLLPTDAVASPTANQNASIVKYKLQHDVTTPFDAAVTSILLEADWLFCGLRDGSVRGFHRLSGSGIHLTGHNREVEVLHGADGVLMSGDFGGGLMFWKPELGPDGTSVNFICAHKMQMPSGVVCIKDILRTQQVNPQGLPSKYLWIGCVGHVVILDPLTLSTVHTHRLASEQEPGQIQQTPDICMDMIIFENTVLCGCTSGKIMCCSVDGPQIQQFPHANRGGILSMTGIMTRTGPQLVLGNRRGFFSFVELPSMNQTAAFQPHDANIRVLAAVTPSMAPPWFLSVSDDGRIAMWQLV